VTPRPAASSSSTHSTSSNTREASVPAIGSPSEAQSPNSQIPPVDRRLKGDAFWAAQKARVEASAGLAPPREAETKLGCLRQVRRQAPAGAAKLERATGADQVDYRRPR
jgi:hypothetical protein